MAEDFISFAFAAGVIAPDLLARPDLEKYDLALRKGHNWVIDYRGGAAIRPPLQCCGTTKNGNEYVRIIPFQFNLRLGNTYVIVLGDQYIRFMQDGSYIVDETTEVVLSDLTQTVEAQATTATPHGFSSGDWIYLNTSYTWLNYMPFIVRDVTANNFTLEIPGQGTKLNLSDLVGAGVINGTVSKIYEISSPYELANLARLDYDQDRDVVYITSNDYAPRKLTRFADNDWRLTSVDFIGNRDAPGAPTIDNGRSTDGGAVYNPNSASLDAGVLYAVTAINADGIESYLADIALSETILDITNNAGFISLEWTAVAGAVSYNIYRSLVIPKGHSITFSEQLGYLGTTIAPRFNDNNIIPDFTRSPLIVDNPFANGAVLTLSITAPGSGYNKNDTTVSIADGTGFEGVVIVDGSGEVIGVRVLNPGSGYTDSSVVTISGAGTGATATITTSPATGNFPACTARVQQRRVYGGTDNLPMTLFASRVGAQDNFDFSSLVVDNDGFDIAVDSTQLTPIQHLVKADIALLVFTNAEVMQLTATENSLITPGEARVNSVAEEGAESIKPLRVRDNTLYIRSGSHGVTAIEPSQLRNFYTPKDISVFSNHYFRPYNKVVQWTIAKTPQNIVWAVLEDGTMLAMAYKPDQNVYGWTDCSTNGDVLDITTVREGDSDVVYVVVRRNGAVLIERMRDLDEEFNYNNWAVDSYIPQEVTTHSEEITVNFRRGTGVTVSTVASSAYFTTINIGDVLEFGGGQVIVTAVATDFQSLTANYTYPLAEIDPQTGAILNYSSWTQRKITTEVQGLWHLEGLSVVGVVGNLNYDFGAVTNGKVEFTSLSIPHIGLDYNGDLVTLPLKNPGVVLEDKKKGIRSVTLRLRGSSALCAGTLSSGNFYDCEGTPDVDYELDQYQDTSLYNIVVGSYWRDDDSIVVRKDKPFRGSLLGMVVKSEVGLD